MLSVSFIKPNVLEVISTHSSFTRNTRQYWYYDLTNKLKNQHGKQGDPINYPMSKEDYDWAIKYYLPKATQ